MNIDYDGILKTVMSSLTKGINVDMSQDQVSDMARMSRALGAGRRRIEQLGSLIKVSTLVNSNLHIDEKLEYILESATDVLNAEASSILLKDEDKRKLIFKSATGKKAREIKHFDLDLNEGIAGWVFSKGEPANVPDVTKDPRYSPKISDALGFETRSIICVPLLVGDKIIGSLEVLNRRDGEAFSNQDMSVLTAFGNQVAISLENSFLYRQSTVDGLTGLYNQKYFKEQVRVEFARASRYASPLSVLMLDLDDFKKYNDNCGHLEGDQLLRNVARAIRSNVRECDIVCRYGGEEFAVILPQVSSRTAKLVAERVRTGVENMKASAKGKGITCTIGASSFPETARTEIQLVEEADKAMYAAKAGGKNRIAAFGENGYVWLGPKYTNL